jgi:hypothetical protein
MPASVNKFSEPDHYDHEFADADTGNKVGTLQVKPSSILWKAKGAHQFYSVSFDDFREWMKNKKLVAK